MGKGRPIAFDATVVGSYLHPNWEPGVDLHRAIHAFVADKRKEGVQLMLPAPAAFEVARSSIYSSLEQQVAVLARLFMEFELIDFDHRATLEAVRLWQNRMSKVRREYSAGVTARKLKADLMIVACALAAGAGVLVTLDKDMPKWTDGRLEVVRPPVAGTLF